VAELAGVSVGTASKILNERWGGQTFGAACVSRVREAARALGYTRSYMARGLRTGRAQALGMPCWQMARPAGWWGGFTARILSGFATEAHVAGYHVVLTAQEGGGEPGESSVRLLRDGRVDALAVPGWLMRFEAAAFGEAAEQVVLVGAERAGFSSVTLDEGAGIRAVVGHLAGLGHGRLLWVGAACGDAAWADVRWAAFREAASGLGLESAACGPVRLAGGGEPGAALVRAAAREALLDYVGGEGEGFTAVVCANEALALGVYDAARALGRRIPEDWSVTGFDDMLAEAATPPMTVASHMLGEMGRAAARLAVRLAEEAVAEPERVRVRSELVVRESTGPVGNQGGGFCGVCAGR
jgi:LacI family transcriptional regulator